MSNLTIVHSPEYANWKFSDNHPTQGRRFINGFNAIMAKEAITATVVAPRLATVDELSRVHSPEYIDQVINQHICNEWQGPREDLARFAQTFAGGTLVALDALLTKQNNLAVHLPGAKHHAQYDHSSGFCVFADFALAADIATKDYGLKVAILDIDAHHGDGTENLTADNPNVLTYSIHQSGIFPGTGHINDYSKRVFNVPIDAYLTDNVGAHMCDAVTGFTSLVHNFSADLIFIAAGADGVIGDPLTDLGYVLADYQKAAEIIAENLKQPILIGGAGGYLPDTLTPEVWAKFTTTLALAKGN